jgi:hypothetical protein
MNIKLSTIGWLMAGGTMLAGCSFEKMGRKIGTGLSQAIVPASDSIGRNLTNAIRTELTKDASRKDLEHFIDSVISPVSLVVRNASGSVRDSIINHQTLIWADSLMQTFAGQRLNDNMGILQATLVGKTKGDITEIEHSG